MITLAVTVSFSYLKIAFSKLSLGKYYCLHKKPSFHVFIECLQIFLSYKYLCTNFSKVKLKSSTLFRSSHRKISFLKVAGLQVIKKVLQHKHFLVNIAKFLRWRILKNICERLFLHFWKVFCKNFFGPIFFSDRSLAKGNFDETKMVTCIVKDCSNDWSLNKNVFYHKIPGEEGKDLKKAWLKTTARPVLRKA